MGSQTYFYFKGELQYIWLLKAGAERYLLLLQMVDKCVRHVLENSIDFHRLDNIYFRFGTKLYRQIFGILMGTNCAPLVADLFLYCYEIDFKRALKTMVHFIWHVMTERLFSLPLTKVGIHFGHVRMCATTYPISLIIFILDLGPSYTDKLLEFRWVQIAHLS